MTIRKNRTMRRIPVLTLIALAAALLVLPASAQTLRVGKAVPKSFSFSLLDLGIKSGIFKKSGLDLEVTSFGGGQRLAQAMAAQSIDIGLGGGVDMAFIAKGSPVIGVAAMAGPPDLILAVRPDSGINAVADLKAKKISVSSPSSVTGWMMRELARQQGWNPDSADGVILVGNSPQAGWAAMRAKEVDGIVDNLGVGVEAQQAGYGRILVRFGDRIKDFHMYVIFARNGLIDTKPELVRAFLKAWLETIAYARTHKAETVDVASEVTGTDRAIVDQLYALQMPIYSDDGRFRPAALATIQRSFVDLKILDQEPDMTRLYTEKFLPGAAGN
jgi:NitT/TauT family transport system substrate-binding protein